MQHRVTKEDAMKWFQTRFEVRFLEWKKRSGAAMLMGTSHSGCYLVFWRLFVLLVGN